MVQGNNFQFSVSNLLFARSFIELVRKWWMIFVIGIILSLPVFIAGILVYKAWPLITPGLGKLLLGGTWAPARGLFGLSPFIVSSLLVTALGVALLIPICLASAIYITQFSRPWLSSVLQSTIDILAGIPSVIFGVWGVLVIVPFVAKWSMAAHAQNTTGYSVLAGALVMAAATLPFVLNMLIELFQSVGADLKESTLAMGASTWQMVRDVVIRKCRPGIIAAFTLGVSRGFGETIAVLMVVGNVVQMPHHFFDAGYPLPALLANNYGEMMSIPKYDAALMLSALVLLVIVAGFNYLGHQIIGHYQRKS